MYSQDLIEAVLKHADIVQIVSSYIPVEKKGRSYVALCPFHDDKNPSMQISPEKQIFKCFVCGTGGNAIGFVEKYEKIPFSAAVRKVAQLCGYNDPRLVDDTPKAPVDPGIKRLHDCINDLQAYYRYALAIPEGEVARQYLASRDLGPDVQTKYGIGYAPKDGAMTVKFLLAKGHSLKTIEDIGIALARGDATSDNNAGRVIFPLHDPSGQVIGFSARRISDDGSAKYVNSPETRLFHKGDVLYNYHNVATSAHRDGYCYVLEGFMDVMALGKAGIPNAIALMGTALTKQQIGLLKRLRCEIRLCLDGDGPGQSAMMKASFALAKAGVRFRLVDYEGDLRDPDELLREDGADALKARMDHLVEAVDFQLNYYLRSRKLETPEERQKVLAIFLPHLREKPAGIEFEDMLVKLSKATGYSADAIRELLKAQPKEVQEEDALALVMPKIDPTSGYGMKRMLSRLELAERTLVHYMLLSREAIDYFEQNVKGFNNASVFATIAEFVLEFSSQHEGQIELGSLLAYIDSSGMDEDRNIGNVVSAVALDETYPPLNPNSLDDCARIIAEESKALGERMEVQRALASGESDEAAEANKRLAESLRKKWPTKPKKG